MSKQEGTRAVGGLVAAMVLALIFAGSAQAFPTLTNGNFETGDFTGWTGFGDTSFNGVQCPGPGAAVFSGNCAAFFGPVGTIGGILQVVNGLVVGAKYNVSFALKGDGGTPNSFLASFGSQTLLSLNPVLLGPYTLYSFSHVAAAASETLSFTFRDDPGFLFLDAVAVVVAPPTLTNGGFETGDFTGWTGFGDTTFNGVQCPGPGAAVFQGNCSAFFGPSGTTGGISQVVTGLVFGTQYDVTFALKGDGGIPSSFLASFGSQTLLSLSPVGSPGGPYTLYSFSHVAAAASETLSFTFRDDPGFIFFDAVTVAVAPVFQSAASRKVHGAAGTFNLPLTLLPLTNPTTEPRQGPAHTIVFTFDSPIVSATATITAGTATAAAPTFSGNDVIVALTGVTNQQYVTVSLTNVASAGGGTGGSGTVRIGFLTGDVNGNRVVAVSDVGLVNAQLAQLVNATNYLKDVNATGTLTVADKGITNANLAKALPPP